MNRSLSVENRILLLCACRDAEPGAVEAILVDEAVLRRVDWDALLAAARAHGLLPLLYERLAQVSGDRIPPAVRARLRGAYGANLLRNRRLGAELAEVVDAFHREGVEALVLKGGALAPTVYDHPAQRPMSDLDLLVPPEQMQQTGAVLEALGFQLSGTLPARMVPFQQRFGGGLEWQRSCQDGVTHLDLHHHLVGLDWCWAAFPVENDAVWAAARPLPLGGMEALQLSAEDTLIHLCLHPALHGFASPLVGYADIDRVVAATDGALSWPRLVERAEGFQVKTVVYYGLQCAQRLLGTPVPCEVLAALQPGGLRLRLLRRLTPLDPGAVLKRASQKLSGVKQALIYAALADRFGAGVGMVRHLLFPGEEWLAARYGLGSRGRAWLCRLVHPLRLARAFLRGLSRPLVESSLE